MPPFPPVDCCRALQHSLRLEPEAIAAFVAWADGGAPEGDPDTYVAPEVETTELPRVDVTVAMPEPYTPDPLLGTDDTRCFLLDWPEAERRYVTGMSLEPGAPGEVHHALLLVANAAVVPSFEALDALSPEPGWSCPGGVVLGYTGWIGGWSPGWTAREMPDGTGQPVDPGSKLILTVHYSVHDGEPVPDTTAIDLMLADSVDAELTALSVYDPSWLGGLYIPANDADVVETWRQPVGLPWEAYSVNLHMHERGSRGSVSVRHADGTEECLLQIDDWDHSWQGDYLFEEPLQLAPDDELWAECHWDNTASNQVSVDGVREEPHALFWAEDQEMCAAFLTVRWM